MSLYAKIISKNQVSNNVARVAMSLTEVANKQADLPQALQKALPTGFSVVAGSFMKADTVDNIVVGYVKREQEKITLDEASERNLVTASANVLLDPATQEQWDVVEREGASLVVKQDTDDMIDLLGAVQSASPYSQMASVNRDIEHLTKLEGNPFIISAFVNPKGEIKHASLAMVDDKASFYVDDKGTGHAVSNEAVVASVAVGLSDLMDAVAERREQEPEAQLAEFEVNFLDMPTDTDSALDYYTRLYAWAPEVQDIAKQIIQDNVMA